MNYEGFYYSHFTANNGGLIKSDGTSVMNVYYDRELRTINFYYRSSDTAPTGAQTAYTYTATTSNTTTPQYGIVNGQYVQLTRTETGSTTENFLTQYSGGTTEYTGTIYDANSNVITNPVYPNTYYRRTNGRNQLYWNSRTVTNYVWSYNGEEYTGTRYTRSTNNTYSKMLTWTGLYGQTLAQNGYSWTTVSTQTWNETSGGGGTTQTLIDSFIHTNPYNLYSTGGAGNNVIYHYKQNLDGTYSQTDRVEVRTSASSGARFNFQNKFDGFTVASYSTGNNGYSASGGATSVSPGSQLSSASFPLHIYHTRNKYKLTLNYNYVGSQASYIINDIPYGATISDYINTHAGYYNPERERYNFLGWYKADVGDSNDPPDFDLSATMPAANKVTYAHWEHIWYLIQIDPNGAEIDHVNGTDRGSTYFWLSYGATISEYKGLKRTHVPDDNGDYVYLNTTFNDENGGNGINANLRNALFIPYRADGDYHDYYNNTDFGGMTYASSGMSYEDFKSCISSQRYRETQENETYTLMGWYLVDEDGVMSSTPYNFGDEVDSARTIRAVWKRSELYYLAYNPVMTGANVGGTIQQTTDPDAANFNGGKYTDQAKAVALAAPTEITPGYAFEGWRIVDGTGHPLEDNVYYDPGEEFYINSDFAESNGCIHLEAFYEPIDSMMRRVSITQLLLDANGGTVNSRHLEPGSTYIYADTNENTVHLEKQKINTCVDLYKYYPNFTSDYGHFLLGWNKTPDAGDYIPDYYADAMVGIDKKSNNTLYALWEPTVYLSFVNETVDTIEVNVSFTNYGGSVYTGHINEVTGVFEREPFNATKVVVQPGETVKLVLPEGEGSTYHFDGTYNGSKNRLYVYNSGISTQTVNRYAQYSGSGELIVDKTGRIVKFYDEAVQSPAPCGVSYNNKAYIAALSGAVALAGASAIIFIKIRKRRLSRLI